MTTTATAASNIGERHDGLVPVIAKIDSTHLGIEDHGLFTLNLGFAYGGGTHQGIGHIVLDSPLKDSDGHFIRRQGTSIGCECIMRVLSACGVDTWEKLRGRTVIVLRENGGWNAAIKGIAPLPTEPGKEFVFSDVMPA